MKKTPVEWLAKELESFGDPSYLVITWDELDKLVKMAKEIEKDHIKGSFNEGMNNSVDYYEPSMEIIDEAEEYYKETFLMESGIK
jgi:hypothetical protein